MDSQPRVYDSVAPRWSLRFCISHKFPGNVDHTLSSPDEEDESGPSQGSLRAHLLQDGGMERQPSVSRTPGDRDVEIPRKTVDQREPRSEKQELWPGAVVGSAYLRISPEDG